MIREVRHTYLLLVGFLFGSCSKETAIPIKVDFLTEVENNDYSVPVRIKIINGTQDADTYKWTFEGGSPSTSTDKNPGTIIYDEAGNYTILLEASNRDGSEGVKEVKISIDAAIVVEFNANITDNNFPPMQISLTNITKGANTYLWTFEGGEPSYSTAREPNQIIFKDPGEHSITLEASNGKETYKTVKTVTVAPNLTAAFDFEVAFEDDDFQAPVTMTMVNASSSAIDYEWTFNEAIPASSVMVNPTITIYDPGIHTLELKASNGKETQTVTKYITVFSNTNLRTFSDVRLGVNMAHNFNVGGAFFSTVTRKVYNKEDAPLDDGSAMDITFFGLNSDFIFNKFVSPDQVHEFTFEAIPNAHHTKFINLQESCDCSASLSVAQFNGMEDDTLLQALTIEETIGGMQDFDSSLIPRIVLFETWDSRKGAIKIKGFVKDGVNSYIIVDIKVQKQPV